MSRIQTDPWQVVPRQVFTPYDCLLISVAFVFLCRVGYLWVIGMYNELSELKGPLHYDEDVSRPPHGT